MKYSLNINQGRALALGISCVNQALIFDLLTGASTWAQPVESGGFVFFWCAREKVASELPLLGMKPDTVYRHMKALDDLGLIEYRKIGKKDCFRMTDKGRSYYQKEVDLADQNSEINPSAPVDNSQNSEINPSLSKKCTENSEINPSLDPKLGNKSEKNSEINPTYKKTKNISEAAAARARTREENSLRSTLAGLQTSDGVALWRPETFHTPATMAMIAEWEAAGVQPEHIEAVWQLLQERHMRPRSPAYFRHMVIEQMEEASGKAQAKREAVKLPREDDALVGWASRHGFSQPKVGEGFRDYRSRLQGEMSRRAVH